MRGFRPQNDANGGAVPFGARGLNELRSLIPQMESMGYKQAQPQVQQPQDNRGAAGLKAIIPQMEAMGYKQQPQQYFADGGFVQGIKREQEQRKQEALAAGQAAESSQAQSASGLYMQDRANEMKDQWGQGKYAQAAGTAARTAVQGLGMYGLEAADKLTTPVVDAARDFGAGLFGSDVNTAKPATQPATQPAAPTQNPTDARLAAGTQTSPMSGAMNQPKPQPKPQPEAPSQPAATTAREVVPGVFNHGRGQYSDDPNGMNMPEGFTGQPSAANNAILERMSDQSKAESMARLGFGPQAQYAAEVQRAKNINADEAARNNSVGARMQRLADPFTAEGRAMRNLQMNIDSSVDRKGRPTAETAALLAQSKAMSDGYLAEPNQQRTIEAGLEREGMQQAGETARAGMREQGANAREQGRNILARDEFNLKKEAAGFQTRAAKRLEDLQASYQSAKTPEERAAIAQQLRELQVKEAPSPYEFKVDPAIRNADGSTTGGSGVWRFNRATGQAERVDGGAGGVKPLDKNEQALAIRDNPSLSREQKVAALKQLGY